MPKLAGVPICMPAIALPPRDVSYQRKDRYFETYRIQRQSNVVPNPPSTESKGSECSFRGRHSARRSDDQHRLKDLSGRMENQGWKVSSKAHLDITHGHNIQRIVLLLRRHRSARLALQPNSKACLKCNISQRYAAVSCGTSCLMRSTRPNGKSGNGLIVHLVVQQPCLDAFRRYQTTVRQGVLP